MPELAWGIVCGSCKLDVKMGFLVFVVTTEGSEVWVRDCDGLRGDIRCRAHLANVGTSIGATNTKPHTARGGYISGTQNRLSVNKDSKKEH